MAQDTSSWGTAEQLLAVAQPGDLIEFHRGTYRHWAVYIGNGDVVHVDLEEKGLDKEAIVRRQSLLEVCGHSQCRINNLTKTAREKGLTAHASHRIVQNALQHAGKQTKYKLFSNNCEFFATSCRYGEAFCDQIDSTSSALNLFSLAAVVLGAGAAAVSHLLKRPQRNPEHRFYEDFNRTSDGTNGNRNANGNSM